MEPDVELMYRPPGLDEHKNITDVLDEVIIELRKQHERILELEEEVESLLLLVND